MYKNLLENIIYISNQMVVLQTMRAGYKLELECDNKQEIKNFRSNAILSNIRIILDDLNPFMMYLSQCEDGTIIIPLDQLPHIKQLIKDMTEIYTWAIQEVKLKNQRLNLMKLEQAWKDNTM
jgi:hypothetical protein